MMTPLQKYLMQRQMADAGQGPSGSGGMPAAPVGPGVADPFTEGENSVPIVNPDDGQNEFDPRRRQRPYM